MILVPDLVLILLNQHLVEVGGHQVVVVFLNPRLLNTRIAEISLVRATHDGV